MGRLGPPGGLQLAAAGPQWPRVAQLPARRLQRAAPMSAGHGESHRCPLDPLVWLDVGMGQN